MLNDRRTADICRLWDHHVLAVSVQQVQVTQVTVVSKTNIASGRKSRKMLRVHATRYIAYLFYVAEAPFMTPTSPAPGRTTSQATPAAKSRTSNDCSAPDSSASQVCRAHQSEPGNFVRDSPPFRPDASVNRSESAQSSLFLDHGHACRGCPCRWTPNARVGTAWGGRFCADRRGPLGVGEELDAEAYRFRDDDAGNVLR